MSIKNSTDSKDKIDLIASFVPMEFFKGLDDLANGYKLSKSDYHVLFEEVIDLIISSYFIHYHIAEDNKIISKQKLEKKIKEFCEKLFNTINEDLQKFIDPSAKVGSNG